MPPDSPTHQFEHLPLVLTDRGPARFPPAPVPENSVTAINKTNRIAHAGGLTSRSLTASTSWKTRQAGRIQDGLPPSAAGIPLLLKIDPTLDLDDLRRQFDFEIVSEQEDGFVIVASQDVDLTAFQTQLSNFASALRGAGNVAKIHELREDLSQDERLALILTETLRAEWPTIADDTLYIFDVSVTCIGNWDVPRPFRRRSNWSDETNNRHEEKRSAEIADAYQKWDDLQYARSEEAKKIVRFYNGEVMNEFHARPAGDQTIPDFFTLRLHISGKGIKDLVLNFPYIFEVVEPDDIRTPQQNARELTQLAARLDIRAPSDDAPAICVIDSGIQEEHVLIEPGIDKGSSHCFLVGKAPTDVADYVKPSGHGTRVAGAVLHGENIPVSGVVELEAWVQNARVLDDVREMPKAMFPPAVIRQVITHFHRSKRKTRLFNHSINASAASRTRHMSTWAAEIDLLSNDYDVLVIQSSGNLNCSQPSPNLGIEEHLGAGRTYPAYLAESCSRIASPSQSLQALTVGSVAYGAFEDVGWRSFASEPGHPSAFSRAGLGIWDTIKPEVVEYGGDCLVSGTSPAVVDTPQIGRDCYPKLIRSTLHGGPAFDKDEVGTSFATPKVARIAARLQSILPDESCLLYRALIVQSAHWPEWTQHLTRAEQANVLRRIGYGVPDIERASSNTPHRTTFITHKTRSLGAKGCHIYQVPIPIDLRRPGDEYDIRIDVTLSYAAAPRRTRRSPKGYLATWLDWMSNGKDESFSGFVDRAMATDNDAPTSPGALGWMIESRRNWGTIPEIRRNIGTVQKDWAIIKSNALPDDFCIAVRGHQGWNHDPESVANYTLAVTFEIVGQEIPIYEPLRTAVLALQTQVEAELETELEMQLEEESGAT
jgi:hypothetical protein